MCRNRNAKNSVIFGGRHAECACYFADAPNVPATLSLKYRLSESNVIRPDEPHGLLLVGHGTADGQGRSEFLKTAELVARQAPNLLVEPSFLESASPTIALGVGRLAERGAADLTVVPLLLFNAGHAKRDIPATVQRAIAATPFTSFRSAQHLGCHPQVQQLSRQRCRQALSSPNAASPAESTLVLVGRGSSDKDATAEMFEFASLCSNPAIFGQTRVAFLAMAEPRLDDVIGEIQELPVRRVVVQPHLLFHGQLLNGLQLRIERAAEWPNRQEWQVTEHLGPSHLLAEAILDRALQALSAEGF